MLRFIGYFLGAVSGIALIASLLIMFYQIFLTSEYEQSSSSGEDLSILALIAIFSGLIFSYVYQTGFGKSKLVKVQEELEILKLKREMQKIKGN